MTCLIPENDSHSRLPNKEDSTRRYGDIKPQKSAKAVGLTPQLIELEPYPQGRLIVEVATPNDSSSLDEFDYHHGKRI